MLKNERDVYFFDLISKTWHRKYKGIKPFPHRLLVDAIHSLYQTNKAHSINNKKQSIYIVDMNVFPDRCEMLIGFSDTLAADPTFSDWSASTRRTEKKVGNEGLEHSAHVIWKYGNSTRDQNCAFLLENARGISSSKVQTFFNKMLRIAALADNGFQVDDPEAKKNKDGTFKKIKVRPTIELVGHPSAEFIKDLKTGSLQEVELFTHKNKGEILDKNGYAIEEKTSVTIKPNPKKIVPKAKNLLDGILPSLASDYEFSRIRFKTETNVVRSVNVKSNNYSLLSEKMYVRKERIEGIGDNLPTAFGKIHTAIIVKMRALLN